MVKYFFQYDLERGEVSKNTSGKNAVRYFISESGPVAEIGDGYRHNMLLKAEYWNWVVEIIRGGSLEKTGVDAIVKGLLSITDDFEADNLVDAIENEEIKEIAIN